jgi:undecaprenyl-diphosphatase
MRKIVNWLLLNDQRAALYVFEHWRHQTLEKWLARLTHLGDSWVSILTMMFLCFIHPFDVRGIVALTLSHIIVQYIKRRFARQRPYDHNKAIVLYGLPLKDFSFPSGHSAAAFVMATALSFTWPSFFALFYISALIVGFSRVYLGYHYPTDVTIGMMIGILSTTLIYLI